MARLKQQNTSNYTSSGNINSEFEQVIRYINAAEHGDKTLAELLGTLFDDSGVWQGPIEFRADTTSGLQYRVGEYTDSETGWVSLIGYDELRGEAGVVVGEIGAPVWHARTDTVATASQTNFDYSHDDTDELVVYVDGVLQREGVGNDYTTDPDGGTGSFGEVIFNSGLTVNEVVTIFKVRTTAITGYTRTDTDVVSNQTVFPFVHEDGSVLHVYKNGILQREGGANDYTTQFASNTVTFNSTVTAGNLITIMTVENISAQAVTGLMLENQWVDNATGKLDYSKIAIDDDEITQAKVNGLSTELAAKAKITAGATAPISPATTDLWLDTSQSPNQLNFYDGTQWLLTSPESSLPTYTSSNAGEFIKVNGTGTALEYSTIDMSSRIAVTQKGAANGVAELDASGRLPESQLPEILSTDSLFDLQTGAVSNADYVIKRIYGQKVRVDAAAFQLASGTCDVTIQVNGVDVGSTYSVSTTPLEFSLGTTIEIDATSSSKTIGFKVSAGSSPNGLETVLATSIIGA